MPKLYLEDLQVGHVHTTGAHALDAAQIIAFAQQFDPQPFHLDDTAAQGSMFKSLAASGWHTAALSMRLLVDSGLQLAGGIIGASGELNWPQPTRPTDILRVEQEILEIIPSRSKPDRGMVLIHNKTINQRDEVLQSFTVRVLAIRRPK